jgi:hypothetical protein
MNIQVSAEVAKILLDDLAVERIISAVGDTDVKPDLAALRFDLLVCYGRYSIASSAAGPQSKRLDSMQKHARRLIQLLKEDEADLGLIRAIWPVDREHPAQLFTQMVFFVEIIDQLKAGLVVSHNRSHSDDSPLRRLTAIWLPEVYQKHFGKKAGKSRPHGGGPVGGPYPRFALQVLEEMGIRGTAETIATYIGFSEKK